MDNLKAINDGLGHTAGDKAIREVAGAIRSVIRADDLLFRWGGDEFLVVLVGLPEDGGSRANRDSYREFSMSTAATRVTKRFAWPSLTG